MTIQTENEEFAQPQGLFVFPFNDNPLDPGWNIYDAYENNGSYVSNYTPGASAIQPINSEPFVGQAWTIYGWSIGYQGYIKTNFLNQLKPFYGRLGDFYAGLVKGNIYVPYNPNSSIANSYGNGLINFPPSDTSLISKVWDGQSDSAFPNDKAFNVNTQKPPKLQTFAYQLPQPLEVPANSQISFGIWLTPSLVAFTGLIIADLTFQIQYDSANQGANR